MLSQYHFKISKKIPIIAIVESSCSNMASWKLQDWTGAVRKAAQLMTV